VRERTQAHFFDGRTSKRHLATLTSERNGRIRIEATGLQREYPLAEVRIGPHVGSIPCSLYFPDGAKCELADEGFVRRLSEEQGMAGGALTLHLLESRLGYALAALVLTATVLWGLVSFGVPALAKQAAFALPQSANIALGQGALKALDRTLFSPSDLDKATQNRIQRHFTAITPEAGDSRPYRLEFRKGGGAGANALALPSGIVVMTDELVRLAQNDEELIAVLAHELGHLVHRHAMRHVLQDSGVAILLTAIVGDVSSVTSLAGALPAILVQLKYSRAFEREADDYALEHLKATGIPVQNFASLLARLQGDAGKEDRGYFSTHPPTRERIERITHSR